MKLKVGDKVRVKSKRGPHWNSQGEMDKWMGKEVTINEIKGMDIHIKEDAGEHGGGKLGGWFWDEEDFEPLDIKETLNISLDGNETIGILKVNGEEIRRAVAKCCKDDTYIFLVGAKLVLERLTEPEQPKVFNMKVVCVSSKTPDFTLGKVYEVLNGTLQGNEGAYFYFRDIEDINLQMESQFIEFVE